MLQGLSSRSTPKPAAAAEIEIHGPESTIKGDSGCFNCGSKQAATPVAPPPETDPAATPDAAPEAAADAKAPEAAPEAAADAAAAAAADVAGDRTGAAATLAVAPPGATDAAATNATVDTTKLPDLFGTQKKGLAVLSAVTSVGLWCGAGACVGLAIGASALPITVPVGATIGLVCGATYIAGNIHRYSYNNIDVNTITQKYNSSDNINIKNFATKTQVNSRLINTNWLPVMALGPFWALFVLWNVLVKLAELAGYGDKTEKFVIEKPTLNILRQLNAQINKTDPKHCAWNTIISHFENNRSLNHAELLTLQNHISTTQTAPAKKLSVTEKLEKVDNLESFKEHFPSLYDDILLNEASTLTVTIPDTEKVAFREYLQKTYGYAYYIESTGVSNGKIIAKIVSRYTKEDLGVLKEYAPKLKDASDSDSDSDSDFTFNLTKLINIHFGKPYLYDKNDLLADQTKTATVFRPNHSLDHGVRQGLLAVDIVDQITQAPDAFKKSVQNYVKNHKKDPLFKRKIQFVGSFQRTGREGEEGFDKNEFSRYRNYGRSDVEFFKSAAKLSNLFENDNEIEEYALGLNDAAQNMGRDNPLGTILFASHSFDLIRMYPDSDVLNKTTNALSGHNANDLNDRVDTQETTPISKNVLGKAKSYLIANGVDINTSKHSSQNKTQKWFDQNTNHQAMVDALLAVRGSSSTSSS